MGTHRPLSTTASKMNIPRNIIGLINTLIMHVHSMPSRKDLTFLPSTS
jgi:hypothetical protein